METPGYTTLTRQTGLLREMQVIANNVANTSTAGFRREGVIFSEYITRLDGEPSLSMAQGNARHVDLAQAGLTQTGGTFDLALQGEGFFLLATPVGERLTRAGAFSATGEGTLVNRDGYTLLDAGGAPVPVPFGARTVTVSSDGTLSADGQPVAQIGVWRPVDHLSLRHQAGTMFSATEIDPATDATIHQGFLEDSNVQPVSEIARMISVQRTYELGQKFLEAEDERQRTVIQTLGR